MILSWDEAERILIPYRWELQSRVLDLVEPHLDKTLRDWEQAIEEQAQQIDDEDARNDFYEFHSDEYNEHLEFRTIFMNSFFSASFALFENQLWRICKRAQRISGSHSSMGDRGSSSFIDSTKKNLRKLGVDFPANTPEWQKITMYRKIRNKIMHGGGILTPKDDINMRKFAKANQIIPTWGEIANLELTRPFCDDALKVFRRFLLEVQKAYELWLKDKK